MRVVFRKQLDFQTVNVIDIPRGSIVRHIHPKTFTPGMGEPICSPSIWFETDDSNDQNDTLMLEVMSIGTGKKIPEGFEFCNTVIYPPGSYVGSGSGMVNQHVVVLHYYYRTREWDVKPTENHLTRR